jgi:hypothetical protein
MIFIGANPSAESVALDPLDARVHYMVGSAEEWRTDLPSYGRLEYRNVYPGIDIVYYGDPSQRLEYDFVLHPGSEPSQIRLRFEGAERVHSDTNGDMLLRTAAGEWRHTNPAIYQLKSGKRHKLAGRFRAEGPDEVAFEIGEYDRTLPLVIDPTLAYSTFLGGSGQDSAMSIAVDAAGNAYLTGYTESLNFPAASGSRAGNPSGVDVYVAKLSPAGKLLYITYLGGSGDDRAYGIAVDSSGAAVVAGWTYSTNFPVVNGAQPRLGGGRDGFVAKLNAAGNALVFSTYLGGSGADSGNAVALDPQGNIYVAGETDSTNFPVLNGFQIQIGGRQDAFLAKFSSAGTKLYGTYLGGIGDDRATAIAVDAAGNAYVTGSTFSSNLPVAHAFQPTLGGGQDAFAAKIGPTGNALIYSTYLGGSGGTISAPEIGNGIAVDSAGCAYIAGTTSSSNFPTSNPLKSSLSGSQDAFVLKLSASGSALVYSTYLGGSSIDMAMAIAVDSTGRAYLAGYTASTDFPAVSAVQSTYAGGYDAFLARLNSAGNALEMATYFGGTGSDCAYGIALDVSGGIYLAGQTLSPDFPTASAIQMFEPAVASAWAAEILSVSPGPVIVVPSPPVSGTGTTATLQLTVTDPAGYPSISNLYLLVGSTANMTNNCQVVYFSAGNALYLVNDSANSYAGPVGVGASGSISNSQCSVNAPSTAVTTSGQSLTLTMSLSFQGSYSGTRSISLFGKDAAGRVTGWVQLGTWTIPASNPVPSVVPSVVVPSPPISGTGTTATLLFTATHPAGYASLSNLYLMVGSTANMANNCQILYVSAGNALYLVNDSANAYAGPLTVGASGSISNSQCSINASKANVMTSGQTLTLTLPLSFQPAYTGTKNVYLFAKDTAAQVTGWVQLGTWTVSAGNPVPSVVVPSPPISGTGATATIQFTATHPAGYANLSNLYLLVGSTANMTNNCQILYVSTGNALYLVNDSANAYAGPLTVGGSGSISNSQCSINASTATVMTSGQTLTLTLPVSFQPAYTGTKNVYLFAKDTAAQVTGWVQLGTWTTR